MLVFRVQGENLKQCKRASILLCVIPPMRTYAALVLTI